MLGILRLFFARLDVVFANAGVGMRLGLIRMFELQQIFIFDLVTRKVVDWVLHLHLFGERRVQMVERREGRLSALPFVVGRQFHHRPMFNSERQFRGLCHVRVVGVGTGRGIFFLG